MSLFGYLANVLVGQVTNLATSSPTYSAGFNPLFAGQIDALRIELQQVKSQYRQPPPPDVLFRGGFVHGDR